MKFDLCEQDLFEISSENDFTSIALHVFSFQYEHNTIYRQWCNLHKRNPSNTSCLKDIPFLPIELFKTHKVVSFDSPPIDYFQSSGTSAQIKSKHYIKSYSIYEESFLHSFRLFFGDPSAYTILAILPNYQQQEHSSLIYMISALIAQSKHPESNFYPANYGELSMLLEKLNKQGRKLLIFGITYALLDLLDYATFELKDALIFETGGMKGRRQEIVRDELHRLLMQGFGVPKIASEYGMCELFSQAYAPEQGIFFTPPQMRVLIRETNDPYTYVQNGKIGGVNIIDLANLYSCSFIASQDLGRITENNGFEILGRFDYSDIRGCSLLFEQS